MTQWIHTKKKVGCLNFMDRKQFHWWHTPRLVFQSRGYLYFWHVRRCIETLLMNKMH
jgi:hypothetical protein